MEYVRPPRRLFPVLAAAIVAAVVIVLAFVVVALNRPAARSPAGELPAPAPCPPGYSMIGGTCVARK